MSSFINFFRLSIFLSPPHSSTLSLTYTCTLTPNRTLAAPSQSGAPAMKPSLICTLKLGSILSLLKHGKFNLATSAVHTLKDLDKLTSNEYTKHLIPTTETEPSSGDRKFKSRCLYRVLIGFYLGSSHIYNYDVYI